MKTFINESIFSCPVCNFDAVCGYNSLALAEYRTTVDRTTEDSVSCCPQVRVCMFGYVKHVIKAR